MSILISSDSTCDLSPAQLQALGVELLPLYINRGSETFRDSVEIFPEDIFAHVAGGGDLCTTAAINIAEYHAHFRALRERCDAVIHLNISSELSSCCQNARLAAEELTEVYVVDSRNLSTGHGLVVLAACELAAENLPAAEIAARLEEIIPRVSASFVLDQLEYMRKGGRCSSVAALGANLLKLKPCIEVAGGKMHVGKKYRGSLNKCLQAYVSDRLADLESIDPKRIFLTHTTMPEGTVEMVRAMLEDLHYFEEILETTAGCTVSCHCGPGTLGVLYVRKPQT